MKTVFITGATSGIGKVTAIELAKEGYHLVIHGRTEEKTIRCAEEIKALTQNPNIDSIWADLTDIDAVKKMSDDLNKRIQDLHILINNAGCVYYQRELTKEGFEKTMVNNHLSHFIITNVLLDKIVASGPARIINVSSGAHFSGRWNPDDIHMSKKYRVFWAYGNTKLYNILFTKYLAEQLKSTRVTANCLHPGVVKTRIGNKNTPDMLGIAWNLLTFFRGISETDGAKTTLYLATSPEVENISGKYFDKCKEAASSEISNNFEAAKQLWMMSKEMSGI